MSFYKKAIFSFILVVFFFVIAVKMIEPVIDRQIKNSISDKKLSEKLKKNFKVVLKISHLRKENFTNK